MNIAEELLNGSRLALSRAITAVENEYDNAVEIMQKIYGSTGNAYIIGITGPPGAGKSTLTDKVAKAYRQMGKTIGIIAIDPTSPFSGGAILGDRIRMGDLALDEGIYIRSMGTRGSLGGLSRKTADAIKLMDAAGKDIIIVETVGVGQSEVDIVKTADTTIVVMVPGLGDDIQAIKAGILEIGDIFAINKADREGVDKVCREIEMMLDLNQEKVEWRPPVKKVIASENQGVDELVSAIAEHKKWLLSSGEFDVRRSERIKNELLALLNEQVGRYILKSINGNGQFDELLISVKERQQDPYSAVQNILKNILK